MLTPVGKSKTIREDILLLGTAKGLEIIETSNIIRIEAISNYCKLFFVDGKTLVVAKLLSWFELKLSPCRFSRLHRSHLVNINYIRAYNNIESNEVVLTTGEQLMVARRKRTQFRKALQAFYAGGRAA